MASETGSDEADRLNEEIESLKKQVAVARKELHIEASTIASSAPTQRLLQAPSSAAAANRLRIPQASQQKLQSKAVRQEAHMQQCFYRICAPVTAFKVLDPDPRAVDGGHVLGLRFEVMSRGQFLRPYYVMLVRPYAGSEQHRNYLRVHRHTLPSAIPLAGLAARHLAPPGKSEGGGHDQQQQQQPRKQHLDRFVRGLRREIVRYHNRMGVSADLRRGLGLHDKARADDVADDDIVEVGIADVEAKQIRLTWADERSGRLVMDDDGKVVKFVVMGEHGRDWQTIASLQPKDEHVEDFVKRLQQDEGD